tara:strand:+ start:611 stop:874 length:264 start_codon:yes stop_codon:yes gene_type:complete
MFKSIYYRFVRSTRRPRKRYKKGNSKQYRINKGIWDDLQHLREQNQKLKGLLNTLAEKTGNAVVGDIIVPLKEKEEYEKQKSAGYYF